MATHTLSQTRKKPQRKCIYHFSNPDSFVSLALSHQNRLRRDASPRGTEPTQAFSLFAVVRPDIVCASVHSSVLLYSHSSSLLQTCAKVTFLESHARPPLINSRKQTRAPERAHTMQRLQKVAKGCFCVSEVRARGREDKVSQAGDSSRRNFSLSLFFNSSTANHVTPRRFTAPKWTIAP
jgi:hypothetical protein